ncbi:hypothetical protein TWF694_006335 [Orbilia ellipsospora]|uniref:F-box domain-containing protein n=1 Tax=Orbilia ellipsospora TaxID=2528407 RepID=A0AAV9XJR7_9PEZI
MPRDRSGLSSVAPEVQFPPEIWLTIYDFLELSDKKSLSSCSKEHRFNLLPLLFRRIRFTENILAAFQAGGSLCHLRSAVRQVGFAHFEKHSDVEAIELARIYSQTLGLFPNVTELGFYIQFHHPYYKIIVLQAMWNIISLHPCFQQLEFIAIKITEKVDFSKTQGYIYKKVPDLDQQGFSEETKAFLRCGTVMANGRIHTDMKCAPKLNRVDLRVDSIALQAARETQSPTGITRLFYQPAQKTLKHLHLDVNHIHRGDSPILFPAVESLRIKVWSRKSNVSLYSQLYPQFPNVKYLRMDTSSSVVCEPISNMRYPVTIEQFFADLAGFKHLKVAMLPFPVETKFHEVDEKVLERELHAFRGGLYELGYIDFWSDGLMSRSSKGLETWNNYTLLVYRVRRYGPVEGEVAFEEVKDFLAAKTVLIDPPIYTPPSLPPLTPLVISKLEANLPDG